MTARRQARAVTAAGPLTRIPPELYEPEASPWRSHSEARAWCGDHAVPEPDRLGECHSAPSRLRRIIPAFAIATGHANAQHPMLPDSTWLTKNGLHRVEAACARIVVAGVMSGSRGESR